VNTAAGAAARRERLAGVTAVAAALLLASAYLAVVGARAWAGRVPLMRGAYLLEGLEVMGPGAFGAAALLAGAAALGLLRRRNWGRRLALVLAAALLGGAVPGVSSAVIDFRFANLAREGVKVIAAAAACFYLSQPETRAAFLK
jgi:hypothetical protein